MSNYYSLLIFILLVLTGVSVFAQKVKISGTVRGTILDTAGKQDLSDATVSVTPVSYDSSDIQFVTTDKNGSFLLKNIRPGSYRLLITFEGYRHIRRNFTISNETKDIDFNILYMQRVTDLMEEVIVQRPPVTIRKDTVEYNADRKSVV